MNFQFIKNLLKNTELKEIFKLPKEWVSMFRLLLSIYLVWLVIFTPRKPNLNEKPLAKYVFTILLFLMIHTDLVSSILLIMIYFLSFQPILPITSIETFKNSKKNTPEPTKSSEELKQEKEEEEAKQKEAENQEFSQMLEENLKRNTTPTTAPTPFKPKTSSITLKEIGNKAMGLEPNFV
jgi:hypothetical protein